MKDNDVLAQVRWHMGLGSGLCALGLGPMHILHYYLGRVVHVGGLSGLTGCLMHPRSLLLGDLQILAQSLPSCESRSHTCLPTASHTSFCLLTWSCLPLLPWPACCLPYPVLLHRTLHDPLTCPWCAHLLFTPPCAYF